MELTHWNRVATVFEAALAASPDERARLLASAESVIRAEVESLLGWHPDASAFFSRAAADVPLLLGEAGRSEGGGIGPYRVLDVVGRGGMGEVVRVVDERLGREVALKLLPAWLSADPKARRRLLAEARALAALDHPHVCAVYDAGEAPDRRVYLAMPLYSGETLRERLSRGPLAPAEVARLGAEAAEGLAVAHAAGIVHCDVKPANLFLATVPGQEVPCLKILDFGIARVAEGAAATGTARGTAPYMAPEQTRGEAVGAPADLWALGVVLYEALAGRRPFSAAGDAWVHAVRHDTPNPLPGSVPRPLAQLVLDCLAKDPARRPASAAEVAARLRAGTAPRRRWRRPALGVALAALVVLGAGVWASRARVPPHEVEILAVLPFDVVGGAEYLGEGAVDLLNVRLDGGGVRTVDPAAVLERASGAATLGGRARLARQLGASQFVTGRVVAVGTRLSVTGALYGADGERRATAHVETTEAGLLDALDRLAASLLVADGGGTGGPLESLTTRSLPALKAHLEGRRLVRQFRSGEAIGAFERAVALDSTFALAWMDLAEVAYWSRENGLETYRRATRAAYRHRAGLPRRARRRAEAEFLEMTGDVAGAEASLRQLLLDDPDDPAALALLADHLLAYNGYEGRPLDEPLALAQRAVRLSGERREGLFQLIELSLRLDPTALDSLVALYPSSPDAAFEDVFRHYPALVADAPDELAEAVQAGPRVGALGMLFHRALLPVGDVGRAQVVGEGYFSPGRPTTEREYGRERQALLALMAGQAGRSDRYQAEIRSGHGRGWWLLNSVPVMADPHLPHTRAALQRARAEVAAHDTLWAPLSDETNEFLHSGLQGAVLDYFHGVLSARLGDRADVSLRLRRLERRAADPLARSMAGTLRAADALARDRPAEALAALDGALSVPLDRAGWLSPVYAQSLPRLLRARAHARLGHPREALRWYNSVRDVGWGRGADYHLPSYSVGRARAFRELGRGAASRAEYRRLAAMWTDVDPGWTRLKAEAERGAW
ncbi:serine/threonine-protein kinase [Rubrivirga marina]|uniref:Protein kinase domain-containing protein n=1 Tax=Rubrivirga marina TaxID=1196024 RepID=A0A271J3K1_9BACT|nr:serine/threonine-protein kinase [Rubrivirga marina]PAP77930.1 hypothetical protein BSZ37_16535 [Rubrivirga marina]